MDFETATELKEIRSAIRELCARFPGEYWRALEPSTYPSEFVDALTKDGWLAALEQAERTASRAAAEQVKQRQTMPALVAGFCQLGEVDRRSFLRAAFDSFPASSFTELHTATKPRKLDYEHADIYMRVMTDAEEFRSLGFVTAGTAEDFLDVHPLDFFQREIASDDSLSTHSTWTRVCFVRK